MKIQAMKPKTYILTLRQAKLFLMNLPKSNKINLKAGDLDRILAEPLQISNTVLAG